MADRLFGITDPGKVRDNNEDVFIAFEIAGKQFDRSQDAVSQFIVAGVVDGVGGYAGGEVAAALTEETILIELSAVGQDIMAQLVKTFNVANEKIIAEKQGNQELSDMACVATLTVVDKLNNELHYIHVGDTRLYLFRDNSLIKISHDQSFVGFLEDSGRLTEAAAMAHPKRNQINQALGLDSRSAMTDTYFETGSSPFLPGDLILLCSDGLTDLVPKSIITDTLNTTHSLKNKAEKLIHAANEAGGKDNITVVLVKNDNPPVSHSIAVPLVNEGEKKVRNHPDLSPEGKSGSTAVDTYNTIDSSSDTLKRNADTINRVADIADDKPETIKNKPETINKKTEDGNTIYKAVPAAKRNHKLTIILAIVCLLFITATAVLYYKQLNEEHKQYQKTAVLTPVVNSLEKSLRDTLAAFKGDTLNLSGSKFKTPVILTQALTINKDSLVIKGADLILRSDSSYKGPALIFSAKSKYIKIDQLILENFYTGIISSPNVADLKNVRFNNVKYPLQLMFEFPDHSFINGRLTRRVYQADSLAKK